MKEKAIGFMYDSICIRDEDGNYLPIDTDIYIPIITQKIDEWLDKNVIKSISIIIFDQIKEVFNITKAFNSSGSSSIIPKNNKVYNYLVDYVKNHPIYLEKQAKSQNHTKEIIKGLQEYKKKNEQYCLYYSERYVKYDSINGNIGFDFYK